MTFDLNPGQRFPDLELPDHTGIVRRLSELTGGDPLAVNFFRGWWCPKEQAFFRGWVRLQDEVEVAYARLVSVSIDPPGELAAFRAGLGARWTFLSDADRTWLDRLGLRETTDTVRAAAQIVDPHGPAGEVSLLVLPRDRSPLFDDPAVSGALRAVLSGPPPEAVSTFVRDSSHFAGAVTVRRRDASRLADDPFARLGLARRLRVGPGLFGRGAPLPGPVIQRYTGQPWPATGFLA